jgi:hypothetical protein
MIFKNSNFSEQTAWISVIFTVFIAVFYWNGMTELEGNFATHAGQIVSLWGSSIIASIIFALVAFSILAIIRKLNGDDEDISLIDERDEVIETKASTWAYYNLSFCIMVMITHIFCQGVISSYPFFPTVPPLDFLIHGLMFSGLFVEFVLRATQIYRYRMAA